MTPSDILQQELEHQLRMRTHKTRSGTIFCRNRHGDTHGWHAPGSRAEVQGGGADSGCQHCQDYLRIKNALLMANVPNPDKRYVVRTTTQWMALDGNTYASQDAAYISSALHTMRHNLTESSFRHLKRVKMLQGDRMYAPEANAYEMKVAKRLEQFYRHLDSKEIN